MARDDIGLQASCLYWLVLLMIAAYELFGIINMFFFCILDVSTIGNPRY